MGPSTPPVRLRSLVREELRALPRNSFALAAVAIVFGVLAVPVSFLHVGEAGLGETLLLTWFVVPLAVAIVVASRVAGARRTRFVDSLYTTPLRQETWLAAQAIVGAVLGLLALGLQLPFLLVSFAWLGVPAGMPAVALAALGVVAFAVALGLFCGVMVGDSSPLAAAGLAGGLAFASFILFMLHSAVLEGPPTAARDALLRVTSLSPLALAADAAGMNFGGMEPVEPWRPVLGLLGLVAGLAGAAWVAYTRAQSPFGWERGRGRGVVVALAVLAVVTPVATAEVVFRDPGAGASGYVPGESTWIAFVAPGTPVRDDSFEYAAIFSAPDLPVGKDVDLEALVLVLAPQGSTVRGVHVEVKGSDVVRVVRGGQLTVAGGEPAARVAPPNGDEPRPVYRVPVTLRAVSAEELGNSPAPVEVHTRFSADGRAFTSVGRMALDAEIPGALAQLLGAGLVLPAAALAGYLRRKHETR